MDKKQTTVRGLAGLLMALMMVIAVPAAADDVTMLRVVVIEKGDGSSTEVRRELEQIPGLRVESHDWFVEQVESRAFRPSRILDEPSDLEWVMDGSDIDLLISFEEESDQDYRVNFITREEGRSEYRFLADRGHDGPIRRGGAMVVRFELEEFLDKRPELLSERAPDEEDVDADEIDDEEIDDADPEALRQRAAADRAEQMEILSRDWLWVRGHARLMQKDFAVTTYDNEDVPDAVYTFETGAFPGIELDVEMFPFGRNDPDMQEAGFYLSYNHGFHGLNITESDGRQIAVSVMDLSIEAGALYRLDTPLDEDNRQIRLKLGGRYDGFLVSDDLIVPSMSMVSAVLGTRLVLPIGIDEFAIASSVDLMPIAFFGTNDEVFGDDSFSWGFGSEFGFVFEVMSGGFASAGYTFRFMRSYFDGAGDPIEHDSDLPVFDEAFTHSDIFDFTHGLRVGFIYQY